MHYAHRLKAQIEYLQQIASKYYDAIYDAHVQAGLYPGMYAGSRLMGNEECLRTDDPEVLRKIIEDLPCPATLEEEQ